MCRQLYSSMNEDNIMILITIFHTINFYSNGCLLNVNIANCVLV